MTLSQKCTDIIKKENGLSSLIIFVANIKKEGIISTQVEYAFYNSIPEYMNQKLDLSSCYSNNQRRLQSEENEQGVNIDININTNSKVDDYSINITMNPRSHLQALLLHPQTHRYKWITAAGAYRQDLLFHNFQ